MDLQHTRLFGVAMIKDLLWAIGIGFGISSVIAINYILFYILFFDTIILRESNLIILIIEILFTFIGFGCIIYIGVDHYRYV